MIGGKRKQKDEKVEKERRINYVDLDRYEINIESSMQVFYVELKNLDNMDAYEEAIKSGNIIIFNAKFATIDEMRKKNVESAINQLKKNCNAQAKKFESYFYIVAPPGVDVGRNIL